VLGATVRRSLCFHQVAGEPPDLAALHFENVTEHKRQVRTIGTCGQDRALSDDNVVFFDKTLYIDDWVTRETWIDDVVVERGFTSRDERSRDIPFDVICHAGQNGFTVGCPETFHVPLHDAFVVTHVTVCGCRALTKESSFPTIYARRQLEALVRRHGAE
jgi:hypothetical protein